MNGILVINKPQGMTSRDVVNRLNHLLHTKKIGHTGTLDPMATGVLVVAVGDATKVISLLTSVSKEYKASVLVGQDSDTLDITGHILRDEKRSSLTREEVMSILDTFVGDIEQEVPIYSAVKVHGKKLYEYARSKEKVVLPKRNVTIHSISLCSDILKVNDHHTFSFCCHVSKGTYIRSLIRDIGVKLGSPCIMSGLMRMTQGVFSMDQAVTLEQIERGEYSFFSILDALKDYPIYVVNDEEKLKIKNGCKLALSLSEGYTLMIDENHSLLAIYQYVDEFHVKPWKVFCH